MKAKVLSLIELVQRPGMKELGEFLLEKSDFLTAPASTRAHLACVGGLATHTLNVVNRAIHLNKEHECSVPTESVIVAALCHDLCKVNYYVKTDEPPTTPQINYLKSLCQQRGFTLPVKLNKAYAGDLIGYLKNYNSSAPIPNYRDNFEIKDELPLGHGEKSLFVANQFINLTKDEALAIRWHMGAWDLNLNSPFQKFPYDEAMKQTKLLVILTLADTEATHLMEVEE